MGEAVDSWAPHATFAVRTSLASGFPSGRRWIQPPDALVLAQYTEVKTMGDGFMASFGSVTKAVECAIALQRAFSERKSSAHPEALEGLSVGLNAGVPIEEDGDLFDATVILASRIAGRAEGGDILVADTARGLVQREGVLVRGTRGVRREGVRGAGASV